VARAATAVQGQAGAIGLTHDLVAVITALLECRYGDWSREDGSRTLFVGGEKGAIQY
jgi:hypothetical protein